ncbi:hypothetical protein [Rhodocaloribacter sp.]
MPAGRQPEHVVASLIRSGAVAGFHDDHVGAHDGSLQVRFNDAPGDGAPVKVLRHALRSRRQATNDQEQCDYGSSECC